MIRWIKSRRRRPVGRDAFGGKSIPRIVEIDQADRGIEREVGDACCAAVGNCAGSVRRIHPVGDRRFIVDVLSADVAGLAVRRVIAVRSLIHLTHAADPDESDLNCEQP